MELVVSLFAGSFYDNSAVFEQMSKQTILVNADILYVTDTKLRDLAAKNSSVQQLGNLLVSYQNHIRLIQKSADCGTDSCQQSQQKANKYQGHLHSLQAKASAHDLDI